MIGEERYYREVDGTTINDLPTISLIEYKVLRRTPKGAWITPIWDYGNTFKRFVLDGEGKRFAYPTKELARHSYIIRNQRQIQHAANSHDRAVKLLELAKTGKLPVPEYFTFDINPSSENILD